MALKNNPGGWGELAIWLLCGGVSLAFLIAGTGKVTGAEMHVANFVRWHFPTWFLYAIGLAEIGGALLLLIPRLATLGASGLAVITAGAVFTHFGNGEGFAKAWAAILLFLFCVLIAYLRRKSLQALIDSFTTADG